jgi:hypothetical protein
VYFARAAGLIKVGSTNSLRQRWIALQCFCPVKVELLLAIEGDGRLERIIHHKFAHLHDHQEWFRPEPELLGFIDDQSRGPSAVSIVELLGGGAGPRRHSEHQQSARNQQPENPPLAIDTAVAELVEFHGSDKQCEGHQHTPLSPVQSHGAEHTSAAVASKFPAQSR